MVSRLGFEPRTLALKGPQSTNKINALLAEKFHTDIRLYNDLQIGCPISDTYEGPRNARLPSLSVTNASIGHANLSFKSSRLLNPNLESVSPRSPACNHVRSIKHYLFPPPLGPRISCCIARCDFIHQHQRRFHRVLRNSHSHWYNYRGQITGWEFPACIYSNSNNFFFRQYRTSSLPAFIEMTFPLFHTSISRTVCPDT